MKNILLLLLITSCATMSSFKESSYYAEYLSYMKSEAKLLVYPGAQDFFKIYKASISKEDLELTPMAHAEYYDSDESPDNDEEIRIHNQIIMERIESKYNQLYSENAAERRSKGLYVLGSALAGMGGNTNRANENVMNRSPSSCSNDYDCGNNQACGSKNSLGLGTCMNVVNQYNQTDYNYQKSFGVKQVKECPATGCN